MKKNIIKYLSVLIGLIAIPIIYLSFIGIETDRFNNQIKEDKSILNFYLPKHHLFF